MSESIFSKALSDFTFDVASRGAIRHLCDLGFSPEEIRARLDYPVSLSKIEAELERYRAEQDASRSGGVQYTYVKEYNSAGLPTFRRVAK